MKSETTYATTHSRQNSDYCLASGLYRPLAKTKGNRRAVLDVTYTNTRGDASVRFRGPEQLGADDLRVSQALIALAGPHDHSAVLSPEPKTPAGAAHRAALKCTGDAARLDAITIRTSRREIVRELGMAWSPAQGAQVIECLQRMATVTTQVRAGSYECGGASMLVYETDHDTGQVVVTINPWLAAAVTGSARHIRIEMAEVRKLRGACARVLHQHLCALINPGSARPFEVDTLAGYVYPEATGSTARSQRAQVRKALAELRLIGWTVAAAGGATRMIGRPERIADAPGEDRGRSRRGSRTPRMLEHRRGTGSSGFPNSY